MNIFIKKIDTKLVVDSIQGSANIIYHDHRIHEM